MTRAEIEGYLLHAKVSPETFVLEEQADLLEKDIAAVVEKALAEQERRHIRQIEIANDTYRNQEARHKRLVNALEHIQALDYSKAAINCAALDAHEIARAELAALESKGGEG